MFDIKYNDVVTITEPTLNAAVAAAVAALDAGAKTVLVTDGTYSATFTKAAA